MACKLVYRLSFTFKLVLYCKLWKVKYRISKRASGKLENELDSPIIYFSVFIFQKVKFWKSLFHLYRRLELLFRHENTFVFYFKVKSESREIRRVNGLECTRCRVCKQIRLLLLAVPSIVQQIAVFLKEKTSERSNLDYVSRKNRNYNESCYICNEY